MHTHPVNIDLIGVGGGGSLVLSGLVRLHLAIKSLGHPHGLAVNVWDPDIVSQANVGRQLFAPNEIGLNKAEVQSKSQIVTGNKNFCFIKSNFIGGKELSAHIGF